MEDARGSVVEDFVTEIAPHLIEDCLIIIAQPLESNLELPPGVVVLDNSPHALREEELRMMTADRRTVLLPCTFEASGESDAVERIVAQMKAVENVMVFILQLTPWSCMSHPGNGDIIMSRHRQMLAMGADDVLTGYTIELDPESFKELIDEARARMVMHWRRFNEVLAEEPAPVPPSDLQKMRHNHHRLLWESIPSVLMPQLARLNPTLAEAPGSVGKYRFVNTIRRHPCKLVTAKDDADAAYFIRVFEKANIHTPIEVEPIYREFRFLAHAIKHPNIVRCFEMLHGPSVVVLILEYAGDKDLKQTLTALPGLRFEDQTVVLHCFRQIVDAVGHCHGLDLVLRNLSFESVCFSRQHDDPHFIKLIDFGSATITRGAGAVSQRAYGTLPCMAPEIASGARYLMQYVDQWSVGIILLEMAGGLSSLSRSVPYDEAANPAAVATSIRSFFMHPDSHARALATISSVRSDYICAKLQRLLVPDPASRANLKDLMP